MVCELVCQKILCPEKLGRNPLKFFAMVFSVTSFSLLVSHLIFPSEASILFVFLIVISFLPAFRTIFLEESKWIENCANMHRKPGFSSLLKRNFPVIWVYSQFFVYLIFSLTLWFILLPEELVAGIFGKQLNTLYSLSATGMSISEARKFSLIFFNNFKVVSIAFLLSFLFGTGALFIVTWNASVISAFIGLGGRSVLSAGGDYLSAFIYAFSIRGASILVHGVPEMLAYFVGGIAGAVLSVGIYKNRYTREIILDSLIFYAISILLLLLAAAAETWL